ncbi:hypothetical protein LZ32DRAFT_622647, partial [Colletotrichum eremochloae]
IGVGKIGKKEGKKFLTYYPLYPYLPFTLKATPIYLVLRSTTIRVAITSYLSTKVSIRTLVIRGKKTITLRCTILEFYYKFSTIIRGIIYLGYISKKFLILRFLVYTISSIDSYLGQLDFLSKAKVFFFFSYPLGFSLGIRIWFFLSNSLSIYSYKGIKIVNLENLLEIYYLKRLIEGYSPYLYTRLKTLLSFLGDYRITLLLSSTYAYYPYNSTKFLLNPIRVIKHSTLKGSLILDSNLFFIKVGLEKNIIESYNLFLAVYYSLDYKLKGYLSKVGLYYIARNYLGIKELISPFIIRTIKGILKGKILIGSLLVLLELEFYKLILSYKESKLYKNVLYYIKIRDPKRYRVIHHTLRNKDVSKGIILILTYIITIYLLAGYRRNIIIIYSLLLLASRKRISILDVKFIVNS